MLAPCLLRRVVLTVPLILVAALLLMEPVRSDQEAGTAIPAESMYHPTVLSHNLYCSFNVAGHHVTEACPNNSNCFGNVLLMLFYSHNLNFHTVFLLHPRLSSFLFLSPACCCLAEPEIWRCSAPCALCSPFIVLAFSMPWVTLFAFQRHSRDLLFSTDVDPSLHLSFLVMSALKNSVFFILKFHSEDAKKAQLVSS